jgi:hypothetical protein
MTSNLQGQRSIDARRIQHINVGRELLLKNPPACAPTLSPAASAACSSRDRFSGRAGRRAASAANEEATATEPGTATATAGGAVEASTIAVARKSGGSQALAVVVL